MKKRIKSLALALHQPSNLFTLMAISTGFLCVPAEVGHFLSQAAALSPSNAENPNSGKVWTQVPRLYQNGS